MSKIKKGPVIGYIVVDQQRHYMSSAGSTSLEAYESEEKGLAAVARGREEEVLGFQPVYISDILDIVIGEMSDVLLDGGSAKRLAAVCEQEGYWYDAAVCAEIDEGEIRASYSSYQLMGMGEELL